MRHAPNLRAERFRVTSGPYASAAADGNNGHFEVSQRDGPDLYCVVSDGAGWDHVSVSVRANPVRLPTWEEMCLIKGLFFRDDEVAVQIHPKAKHYVNNREVLHLWRPQDAAVPCPPVGLVGIPEARSPEGGDGTTVCVVDLDRAQTEKLRGFADSIGADLDEAMTKVVQHAIRVLGAMPEPQPKVDAYEEAMR